MKDYEKEADELVAKFKRALFKENIMDATRCSILCLREKIKAIDDLSKQKTKSILSWNEIDDFKRHFQNQIEYLKSKL